MNLNIWKEKFIKKIGSKNISIFISTRKEKWEKIKELVRPIPFPCLYLDPTKESTYPFIYKMEELNEKAYGKKMSAPIWTYSNFGTIGAGITGGFIVKDELISKFNVVGDVGDSNISHEWTLLTDPKYQGKNIGTATLALAMQICSHKKYHTFITQTDNPSNIIYLKNIHPLQILAYGFVHTKPNSLFIKTKIPKNPFETFINSKKKKQFYNKNKIQIEAYDHHSLKEINNKIQNGSFYYLLDWIKNKNNQIYLIFKIKNSNQNI
jgi:GNAT superfamily N-acetyltransferase